MVSLDTVVAIVNQTKEIRVFPNPVKDGLLNITLSNMSYGNYSIRLINILGKVTMAKHLVVNQHMLLVPLNVNTQAAGIYYLQVFNDDVQMVKTILIE